MAEDAVQNPPATPEAPAENPTPSPFDIGDTELHFEQPRDDKGRFAPVPVEPSEQLAPAPAKHPEYLVERANDLGLDDEDISALSTNQLQGLCFKLMAKQLKQREQAGFERTLGDATVRTPAPQAPQAPAEPEVDWGVGDNGEPLKESDYVPGMAAYMKRQVKQEKELAELKAQLHQERQANVQRQTKSAVDLIDAAFAKLGNERLFGKGPAAAMREEHKAAFKRRVAVLHEAGIDLSSVNRGTIVQQLRDAAQLLYSAPEEKPDPYAAALEEKKPKPISVKDWNNGAVAKPTARKGGAEPKGDSLAVKNLTDKMRERGLLDGGEEDSEIEDGLLG